MESVPEEAVRTACGDLSLPKLGVIEQQWQTDPIPPAEVTAAASAAVSGLNLDPCPEGGSVAVGVGSRGIDNLPAIVRGVVDGLSERGYEPFIVPAMGSHGGATAEGQREKLETLGVTPETAGCEIRSSMAVEQVGTTPKRDVPVYADANAVAADAIVPVNRIKPHTDFSGDVESGLSKMLVIGMGKQRGAKMAHDWAVDWSLRNMIPEITTQLLEALPVAGGVAIIEDEHDDTTHIEGVVPSDFLQRERELLEVAWERMPKLPFEELDVLVVDQLGKDVSGQGMDTNVTGRRHFTINEPEPETADIKRIYARGFTEKTDGNAMGMGQADVVHEDIMTGLDWSKSLINAITASTVRGVRLPPVVENDRAGLTTALGTIGPTPSTEARVLRVTDTMRLERCYASPSLVDAARERDDLRVVAEPTAIEFDDGGDFVAASPDR
ncbi:MAG: DUF362 domain-containing protein [Natronomonas sp.]